MSPVVLQPRRGGSSTNGGNDTSGTGTGRSASCSTTLGVLTFFGGGGFYGGGGGSAQEVVLGTTPTQIGAGGGGGSGFVAASATGRTNQAGVRSGNGSVTITYTVPTLPGNIFAATFEHARPCTSATTASSTGGKLGSKTYHFIGIPLGTTLHPEPVQSHIHITWPGGGRFHATRGPGC